MSLNPANPDTAVALQVIHRAAAQIAEMPGVTKATADNDHKSGEIIFSTEGGSEFVLTLKPYIPDEPAQS